MARPREFDEADVLSAACDQFWSTGYAGTSIDAIVAATGLGKGSLYGAFGGKHELFVRVFERYCADRIASATHDLDGPDDEALERLKRYLRKTAEATAADTTRRGCMLAKGTSELSEHDPTIAKRARETFDSLEDLITGSLEAAQRNHDVDPGADARALAQLLLAVMRGIDALGKAGRDGHALRTVVETALAAIPSHQPRRRRN